MYKSLGAWITAEVAVADTNMPCCAVLLSYKGQSLLGHAVGMSIPDTVGIENSNQASSRPFSRPFY